jgi:hypothetical protein
MRLALVGLVAVLGLGACDGGSDEPSAPTVAAPAVPRASFRVVYKIDDTVGDTAQTFTDVVQVAHPWNSRVEHREGPPPGGTVLSSTVQNQRFTFNNAQGSTGFATRRVPGALSSAPAPEVLEAAARAGLVDRLGESSVAGEACTRWAYRSVNRILAKPTAEEGVEACVTGDGIPLREAQTLKGKLVRVAEAVQVERNPPVTDDTFQTQVEPGDDGGPAFLERDQLVTEGRQTGKGIVKAAAPAGFRASRQVTVNRQAGPGSPPIILYIQGFESGPDLVTTEQVTTPGGPPWSADEGETVDLGDGRDGRIVYRTGWVEIRVTVDGKAVRVTSTRPALARAVAGSLSV